MRRALALGLAGLALSCAPREGALLVELAEVTPRSLEVGDRLRITGSGFPEGRPARVVLRGDAMRAGAPVTHGVEIVADARLVAPHALEVQLTPELAAAICDRADPRHTTLRADVEVRFASVRGPTTTVNGRLEGVTLDVTPELRSETSLAMLRGEGRRFAQFVGAEVTRSEQGLTVTSVAGQSRASRAGLAAGDVVIELEGLFVHGLADFVPPPNRRVSRLSVRRGLETLTLELDTAGFRFTSPASLATAAAVLLPLALLLGLGASPFGRVLGLFERRLVERLRERHERLPARSASVLAGLARELPASLGRQLALVAVTALLVLIAFGQSLVASEIDLVVLPLLTLTGLVAVVLGARGGGPRPTLLGGVGRALALLLHQVPLLVLLALGLLATGSFRAADLVRSQGGWPWQWHAFASPALAVAALLALGAQVPLVRPASPLGHSRSAALRDRAIDVAQWTHELVVCGLLALTVLGGSAPGDGASFAVELAGAALLLVKTWALLLGVVFVRWTLGVVDVVAIVRASATWLVLPSLALLGLVVAARAGRLAAGPFVAAFERYGAWAALVGVLLGLALLGRRVLRQARRPVPETRVLPWV